MINCPSCGHTFLIPRKRKLTPEQVEQARQMRREGEKLIYIASVLKCSSSLVWKVTNDASKKRVRSGA